MKNVIFGAIAALGLWFQGLQVKQLVAVVLVSFFLLTTQATPAQRSQAIQKQIDQTAHQGDSQRPKTTGEWNREAQEDASFGERVKQIGEESLEAFQDFAKVYPSTAKRSAESLPDQPLQNQ